MLGEMDPKNKPTVSPDLQQAVHQEGVVGTNLALSAAQQWGTGRTRHSAAVAAIGDGFRFPKLAAVITGVGCFMVSDMHRILAWPMNNRGRLGARPGLVPLVFVRIRLSFPCCVGKRWGVWGGSFLCRGGGKAIRIEEQNH